MMPLLQTLPDYKIVDAVQWQVAVWIIATAASVTSAALVYGIKIVISLNTKVSTIESSISHILANSTEAKGTINKIQGEVQEIRDKMINHEAEIRIIKRHVGL